jgi:hypothetical protein
MHVTRLCALGSAFTVIRESWALRDTLERSPLQHDGVPNDGVPGLLNRLVRKVVRRDDTKRSPQGLCVENEYWDVVTNLNSRMPFCASFLGIPDATITVTRTLPPS